MGCHLYTLPNIPYLSNISPRNLEGLRTSSALALTMASGYHEPSKGQKQGSGPNQAVSETAWAGPCMCQASMLLPLGSCSAPLPAATKSSPDCQRSPNHQPRSKPAPTPPGCPTWTLPLGGPPGVPPPQAAARHQKATQMHMIRPRIGSKVAARDLQVKTNTTSCEDQNNFI